MTDRKGAVGEAYMTFQATANDPYQILTETARIIFVELEKFNPKNADARDLLTAWLSFLKDPLLMDDAFLKVEEVKDAMDRLKYISASKEVQARADLRQRTINDRNSELTVAVKKGREEGREEGIAIGEGKGIVIGKKEGKVEGALAKAKEYAIKMLQKGISLDDISEFTELSIEEIKSFRK